ncbi:hypothetical protein [Oleiharenicola sp. Vm1]|uniref:hypothetical protein n=1 Tax=Oleiharenicola sp. Vm1 TaxID=3398393 RepID=UPI0039F5AB26
MPDNLPLAYDPKRLHAEFAALRDTPRTPRVLDVLMQEKEEVTALLKDGRTVREIWDAFRAAGLRTTYSGFQRAAKQFIVSAGLPSTRGRRASDPSRFLVGPHASAKPAPGKTTAPSTRGGSAAERRKAGLGAPSVAALEERRLRAAAPSE